MIAVQIVAVERLGTERYRLSVRYGEIVVSNVVGMLRDGHVHAVHPPAIRTRDGWAPMVTWSFELREMIRAAAEIAILENENQGAVH